MQKKKNASHFDVGFTPFHINYRLHGSIAQVQQKRIERLTHEAYEESRQAISVLATSLRSEAAIKDAARLSRYEERLTERVLHGRRYGPQYLRQSAIRQTVMEGWLFFQRREEILLHSLCLMPNHVHVILSIPRGPSPGSTARIMRRHKSFTARECNLLLDRTGEPFWAGNYFDRTIRRGGWLRTMWYVLNNPVKAKLVDHWRQWPGNWVNPRFVGHFED